MTAGNKIYNDCDYHLMTPLPSKVWYYQPYMRGIMWCRNCHKDRFFNNPYKYLEYIGIQQKLVPAYHEMWICEMCNRSEY